jgi:hypothetical protein
MNQLNNEKLVVTSRTTLRICQILLTILILMAVIPWIIPASTIGDFMLGMYSITNYIQHQDFSGVQPFSKAIANFNGLSRVLGFIGSVISLLPLLSGTIIMIKLSKKYARGQVFNLENAKSYSKLGIIYLLSSILLQPISEMLFSLCVSINNPVGKRFIAFSFNINNVTAIFFAIMLIVIGQVMKQGQKISEEQELTI